MGQKAPERRCGTREKVWFVWSVEGKEAPVGILKNKPFLNPISTSWSQIGSSVGH